MAHICLVYPREINLNFFPLGLGYVAGWLERAGHKVTFLDITVKDLPILDSLAQLRPDMVGLSITTPQVQMADASIARIRKAIPGVPIVVGGIHPSYFKATYLDDHDVDYIVYGEGEVTMEKLVEAVMAGADVSGICGIVYRDPAGKSVITPPRPLIDKLDELAFPLRSAVNYHSYLQPPGLIRGLWTERCANITTSRGCPGACKFCGVNWISDRTRRRSTDNVIAEIDYLVEHYDIDGLYFMDDVFLMKPSWVEELCQKMIDRKYRFKWSAYGRVDTVNERMLKIAKEAGCVQVEFGIESCSDAVLARMEKNVTFPKIKSSVDLTKACGLRALGSFIIGFPEDTEAEIVESFDKALQLDLDFTTCYFATPYPGSELYEQAVKENRILEPDMSKWFVRTSGVMRTDLDQNILITHRNAYLAAVRWRNARFFLGDIAFMSKLAVFMVKNLGALARAIGDAIRERNFDDLGYYFYARLSAGQDLRNTIEARPSSCG